MYTGMKTQMNLLDAVVKKHLSNGTTNIEYVNETINLHSVKWEPTRIGQKLYLPKNLKPPHSPLTKIREETAKPKFFNSSSHSAKAFADDLTVFS